MATFRFTDNLANPELYGIVLDTFFEGGGGLSDQLLETKYILSASNGRRIEFTFYLDELGKRHVTAMDFFVPDPQAVGESVKIATIDGFDRIDGFTHYLDYFDTVDTIIGSNGGDVLRSYGAWDKAGDILLGNGGNDVLSSDHRDTVLDGGAGDDTIRLMTAYGLNRSAVNGGDGFDTLELTMTGTYTFQSVGEHAALAGIERIVLKTNTVKTVQLQTDQLAGLASNLSVVTEAEYATFRIVRKSGEAVNIDLSGWSFSGWNLENAPYNRTFTFDLTEDAAYDDHMVGSIFRDDIRTFSGNDFIDGGAGYDALIGGQGADTVRGGTGDDTIVVEDGDVVAGDIIDGGEGKDTLYCVGDLRAAAISGIEIVGVSGATAQLVNVFKPDAIFETKGSVAALIQVYMIPGESLDASNWSLGRWNAGSALEIVGSASADRIVAPTIETAILGGDGLDIVRFDRSQQSSSVVFDFSVPAPDGYTLQNGTVLKSIERFELVGGSARDILAGGAFGDSLVGGASVDMLDGGAGDDFLDGGAGADFLDGGLGNDTYVVSGADVIVDAGGYDTVLVANSFSLAALPRIERLSVQVAASTNSLNLTGNALANALTGNAGANVLSGADGSDTLWGLAGSDLLKGGLGNDVLWGGVGKDSFEFNTKPNGSANVDFIADFRAADDTIRLDDAIFKGLKRGALAKGAFVLGRQATDEHDRIIYDKAAGTIYYDADGTGASKQILIAKLPKKAALSHLDFIVI